MGTQSFMRSLLVAAAAALLHAAQAQPRLELGAAWEGNNIVLHGMRTDGEAPVQVFQAIWRGVPQGLAVFQVQQAGEPDNGLRLMLDRVVEAGLIAYLDGHLRFTKEGVASDLPVSSLVQEMNALVLAAADDLGVPDAFVGLSPATREQLERLVKIQWGATRTGIDGAGQDKYLALYRYVRIQRDELERQLRADLLPLANVVVIGPKIGPIGTQVQINSTCGTVFDEENFLCALDLQLADSGNGGVDPVLGERLLKSMAEQGKPIAAASDLKVRKRDRWLKEELDRINERIDQLDQRKELWNLRDRLDDMDDRITGLELEVREVRSQASMPTDNPSANLSTLVGRNITVRFARNSVSLDAEYRVLLNEVFEQLARSPQERVLITGYTDRSGDPTVNLRLSEQRATAVRNYLMQRGIAAERLLVNHYGDSRSTGRNPDERRVEVEWLR